MREVSESTAAVLTGSREVSTYVSAYYNGRAVLDELPIVDGSLEYDNTQEVPGSVSLTLPRFHTDPDTGEVIDLLPTKANAPLAAEGTQLAVSYVVSAPGRGSETISLGWYRIQAWEEGDEGTISVSGNSLEALIQESRLLKPRTTGKGARYSDAFTGLLGGLLPLLITADDTVRTSSEVFEEDRLEALRKLCESWPARMFVDDTGTLEVTPPFDDDNDTAVLTLTDGEGGTIVAAPRSGSREGVYNAVKASGEADGDKAPVSAVAYLRNGPRRWNGPYGNVPYFYTSPLLTTAAQARSAATTRLRNLQQIANPVTVETPPDPRIQEGDVLDITTVDRGTLTARVDALSFPLTYAETMTLTCHELGTIVGLDDDE